MTKEKNLIEERNEILQPVVDRLVYLKGEDLETYKLYLKILEDLYPIKVTIEKGIRIYHVKRIEK